MEQMTATVQAMRTMGVRTSVQNQGPALPGAKLWATIIWRTWPTASPQYQQMAAMGSGSQAPVDQTTGKTGAVSDAIRDAIKAYQHAQDTLHTYQTWGRTIDFQVFEATGPDETAQRADATAIAALKPFMVYDQTRWATGGAPALATALAAKKIVVVSASTTPEIGRKSDPYRWANAADDTAALPLTASFVGRSLAGEKAQWAGDSDLKTKMRSFGTPVSIQYCSASLSRGTSAVPSKIVT